MRLLKPLFLLLTLLPSGCQSYSQKALKHLNKGNHEKFCQISWKSVDRDHYSKNNLGVCYENGWGGFPKSTQTAMHWYGLAARHGVPKAIENLERLGAPVPKPDLLLAEQAEARLRSAAFTNAVAQGLSQGIQNYNRQKEIEYQQHLEQQQQQQHYYQQQLLIQEMKNIKCTHHDYGGFITTYCN